MTSVTIATEKGDIDVDLFTTDAPKASQNFVDLAKKGFYDDVDLPSRHPRVRRSRPATASTARRRP